MSDDLIKRHRAHLAAWEAEQLGEPSPSASAQDGLAARLAHASKTNPLTIPSGNGWVLIRREDAVEAAKLLSTRPTPAAGECLAIKQGQVCQYPNCICFPPLASSPSPGEGREWQAHLIGELEHAAELVKRYHGESEAWHALCYRAASVRNGYLLASYPSPGEGRRKTIRQFDPERGCWHEVELSTEVDEKLAEQLAAPGEGREWPSELRRLHKMLSEHTLHYSHQEWAARVIAPLLAAAPSAPASGAKHSVDIWRETIEGAAETILDVADHISDQIESQGDITGSATVDPLMHAHGELLGLLEPSNRCLVDPRKHEVVDTDHTFAPPLSNDELLAIYDYGKGW